jgi:hypothetical protein
MDLHNLYRPSPPATQQQAAQAPTEASSSNKAHQADPMHTAELHRALAQAEVDKDRLASHVAHWEKETQKMDRIARSALEEKEQLSKLASETHKKLEAKREVKRKLKSERDAAQHEADTWRARYNQLMESRVPSAANQAVQEELRGKLAQAQAQEGVLKARLAQAEALLKQHDAERPIAIEKLKEGGRALRELHDLEPKARASELLVKRLTEEVAGLRAGSARAHQLEIEVAGLRVAAAQTKQLELEVVTARDKLRAATNDVSAKAGKLQACADMLARAEQVLKTCSQLHASKGESHALVRALAETTGNIDQFLRSLEPGK